MALSLYKKKRSFRDTPEPTGGKAKGGSLRFVVQKHDASRLHYDFRLEMDGVLKSWAVPKGPSLNPDDKRLAMMVEDHPYDYKDFEGIIPDGNYGAGTVIVWDEGSYEPITATGDKAKDEKELLKELKSGSLKVHLHGHKLKGEFALVHLKNGREENAWLLIKHRDKYAKEADVTKKDKSVVTGKTIAQVEKTSTNTWGSNKKAAVKKAAVKKTATVKKKPATEVPGKPAASLKALLKQAPKASFPEAFQPMLATLVDKPFDEPGWLYEVKWDGYRALAYCHKKSVSLLSRNMKTFDEKFYPIHQALVKEGLHAVLDGEIVVVNKQGFSNFNSLQNWRSEDDGELLYYLFDILWLDGHNLMPLPLEDRRSILRQLPLSADNIRISENFNASGTDFFAIAQEMNIEGIIAKKAGSTYMPGERSREWLKIKTQKRHEVVIGGYTRNTDSPKLFSALLVGVFEKGVLQYTGKIGTGFPHKVQQEMMKRFRPLVRKTCPFKETPDVNKPSRFRPNPPHATVVWLKPELVCEVSYQEATPDGVMRQPSFEGLREDKKASSVVRETAKPTEEVVKENVLSEKKIVAPAGAKNRKTLLNPTDETQVRVVEGHDLRFTNLSKLYWPKEKISKRDMINYYYQVAPYMVPYLNDRPQSLNRHPNGIGGKSFYQKNVTGKVPDWVDTFPYHSDADGRDKNFLVCNGEASLLYMASLGCIEINPWSSRKQTPDNPDWCIIDLDPGKNTFEEVIEAAQVTKAVLDSLSVPSFPKTSGSTGIHIYIPLGAKYSYEHSKEFARLVVKLVHAQTPGFTSIERQVSDRKGKMYLDFLQNRPQATLAAPYSVRPKPGATVSMPLHWEEVKKGLKMSDFTLHNAVGRLKQEDDLFKGVLGKGIDMEKVLKKAEKVFGAQ